MGGPLSSPKIEFDPSVEHQCCFVDEHGVRCLSTATFWIGRTFLDYSYGCGDHAEDLRMKGHTVVRLADDKVIETPKEHS